MSLALILVGLASCESTEPITATSLATLLERARAQEAYFHVDAAVQTRSELLQSVSCMRPGPDVAQIAAATFYDAAWAALVAHDEGVASAHAREALTGYARIAWDSVRYPPDVVSFFAMVRERLDAEPKVAVSVLVPDGARLIDGAGAVVELGSEGALVLTLGSHAFWLATGDNFSGPYAIDTEMAVTDLRPGPGPGPAPAVLFAPPPHHMSRPGWLLSVVPFGVGQWLQDRPLPAALFLVAQGSLLVWNVVNARARARAEGRGDWAREEELRSRQNVAATLFWASLVVSVGDGLWAQLRAASVDISGASG